MNAARPRWLPPLAGLAVAFLAVPLVGLAARIPWLQVPELLATPSARAALWLSLRTCTVTTVLAVVLGLPLALVLARARGAWAAVGRGLAMLPMVLPPVVAGLALLATFGRRGLLGQHLSLAGIDVAFTTAAVVLAQTFVAMPFFVIAVEGALRTHDERYEAIAATLGARPGHVLRRITLPLLWPAVVSGATMAFARALGEFGATLTFAGSLQGTTRTLPLQIYLQRETDPGAALALSLLLIAAALALMLLAVLVQHRAGGRRAP